jgi:hypothetical protein
MIKFIAIAMLIAPPAYADQMDNTFGEAQREIDRDNQQKQAEIRFQDMEFDRLEMESKMRRLELQQSAILRQQQDNFSTSQIGEFHAR